MARLDNIGAASATGVGRSAGTRALMVVAIAMAVLIVLGTTVLVVVIARRLGGGAETHAPIALQLGEPDGTRIAGVAAAGDRLAVQLQGGGPDRIVLVDPRSGAIVGRIGVR